MVTLPKDEGGLGVLNLSVQNESLLMKHLHKFFNKAQILWVQLVWDKYYAGGKLLIQSLNFRGSFWWRDNLKILTQFKGIAMVTNMDGKSCFLWLDMWNDMIHREAFPKLFSFAKNQSISISVATSTQHFHELFHLPLSPEAFARFQTLSTSVQNLSLQATPDQWSYIWGSVLFSSSMTYKKLIGHRHIHAAFKWIWKSSCQIKKKFFFWLILQDRLSTRALLRKRNMALPDYHCVLCNLGIDEDLLHLLFHCPFSLACWYSLQLTIPNSQDVGYIVESLKSSIAVALLYGNPGNYVLVNLDNA
jgi:hypothetical protein